MSSATAVGLTPWEECASGVWLKRDDLYEVAGVRGGKARTCWHLATQGKGAGLVTAGARQSPQVEIVAAVGRELGLPVRAYVPSGELSERLQEAERLGAEFVRCTPGYNTVIRARAREDAERTGYTHIPFGMECHEAVEATASQVEGLPLYVQRLVVPVGSGMSLAGVLWGLTNQPRSVPVLGVVVGADPTARLDRYAPPLWRAMCLLERSDLRYEQAAEVAEYYEVALDPIYEAKCLPYLRFGDGLWCVGIRAGVP